MVSDLLSPALAFVGGLPAGSRVGVVGSRSFPSLGLVREFVAALPGGLVVVSGGAAGVDSVAAAAARSRGLSVSVLPGDWGVSARGGGMIRNRRLVAGCAVVVVFLCCGSAGASSAVALCRSLGVPVFVVPCSCGVAAGVSAPSLWG